MSHCLPSQKDRLAASERPDAPVAMYQEWRDLLFLHWTVDPGEIVATLPDGLFVDTHEGEAFVGLVPFYMVGIRPRFLPAVPGISNFLEMNVRTYVHDERGRPGVWFYSLDANQSLAVAVARRVFHLPYTRADMEAKRTGEGIRYTCRRRGVPAEESSTFRYRGTDTLPQPEPGSLEYFLLERYLLFAHDRKTDRLFSGAVHHTPYPVSKVEMDTFSPVALQQAGFPVGDTRPVHAIYSSGVEVEVFGIESA